jgi:hypothetical protein
MEQNLLRCGIQRRRFFCGVGYNGKGPALLDKTEEKLLHYRYNGRKFVKHLRYSYSEGKPLLLYPTTEENLLHCIPQWKKTSSVVSHNRGNLFRRIPRCKKCCCVVSHSGQKKKNISNYTNINFSAKMIFNP